MRSIEKLIGKQIGSWDRDRRDWYPCLPSGDRKTRRRPAITVCSELGCGARRVADLLHRRNGYEIYGYRLIDKIAENMHTRRMLIDRLDQRRRSYIRNLIDGLLAGRHVDEPEYLHNLVQVLRVFILEGGCILLGRGAPYVVEPDSGIRVQFVAPQERRICNLMGYYKIDAEEAQERIRTSDRERAEFAKHYFDKDIGDPNNYDLVVNLERISPDTGANVVVRALEVMPAARPASDARRSEPPDPRDLVERKIEEWETEAVGSGRHEVWEDMGQDKAGVRRLPVIAFSPKFGCGSRRVSEILESRLGYEVFGYGTIDRIAEDETLSPRIVGRLDPHAKSAIQRLLDDLLKERRLKREEYFSALVRTLRALIVQGGVILLGRGSTFLVHKDEGLRVRLVAPDEKRIENLKRFYSLGDEEAAARLRQGDGDRAEFVRKYFGADSSDSRNFDLTINMDRIGPDAAACIVARALEPWQD